MGLLIFKENGFAMIMSILGFFCGGMTLAMISYDQLFTIPTLVAGCLCFFFYFIAILSKRKSIRKRMEAEAEYKAEHPDFF